MIRHLPVALRRALKLLVILLVSGATVVGFTSPASAALPGLSCTQVAWFG